MGAPGTSSERARQRRRQQTKGRREQLGREWFQNLPQLQPPRRGPAGWSCLPKSRIWGLLPSFVLSVGSERRAGPGVAKVMDLSWKIGNNPKNASVGAARGCCCSIPLLQAGICARSQPSRAGSSAIPSSLGSCSFGKHPGRSSAEFPTRIHWNPTPTPRAFPRQIPEHQVRAGQAFPCQGIPSWKELFCGKNITGNTSMGRGGRRNHPDAPGTPLDLGCEVQARPGSVWRHLRRFSRPGKVPRWFTGIS